MGDTGEALHRGLAVVKDIAERTGKHLFEPDREHAIGAAERDQLARGKERGRSGRAIIVDVDDRNVGAADPVDRRLARGRIAIHRQSTRLNSCPQCASWMPYYS